MSTRDEDLKRKLLESETSIQTSGLPRIARTLGQVARMGLNVGLGRFLANEDGSLAEADVARIEALVRSLGELKGVPMKMGQILGYIDESLPPELCRALSMLQTHSPPIPFSEIEQTLRDELGNRAHLLLKEIGRTPVAAASIGQVHRATLPDGIEVAVKVQYRGIEAALRAELSLAGTGARTASLVFPGANVAGFIEEARERLLGECDYVQEAVWQKRFAAAYNGHPVIRVPAVHDEFSARRVLTTTWMPGRRFDDWLASDPPASDRNRVGEMLYEFYLGSMYRYGLFNADPHPGNYLVADGGGLVMLDYGCARAYGRDRVEAFVRLREAVQADAPERIRDAFAGIGANRPSDKLLPKVRELLRAFFAPVLEPGPHVIAPTTGAKLGQLMASKKLLMSLGLPPDSLFLFRIKFGLYVMLSRVGASVDWAAVEASWSQSPHADARTRLDPDSQIPKRPG